MDNIFVPLAFICMLGCAFFAFFGFFAFLRYMRYKETIILAEKGLVHPGYGSSNGSGTLRWGLAITGLGLALCLGLYPIGFTSVVSGEFPLNFGPWMLAGLLPTFFGLSLIAISQLGKKRKPDASQTSPTEAPDME